MDNTNTGGPAFPTLMKSGDLAVAEGGMTLRDYFAAKALPGIISMTHDEMEEIYGTDEISVAAYQQADAILRTREAS